MRPTMRGVRDVRRKNIRLDQRKLNAAKRLLRASTETQAIERALDLVVFRREVLDGLARFAGRRRLRDVFAAPRR